MCVLLGIETKCSVMELHPQAPKKVCYYEYYTFLTVMPPKTLDSSSEIVSELIVLTGQLKLVPGMVTRREVEQFGAK